MVSTNQAVSRLKLFQQMAKGEQRLSTWPQKVLKQAKRCTWQDNDEKWAVRDTILYHHRCQAEEEDTGGELDLRVHSHLGQNKSAVGEEV